MLRFIQDCYAEARSTMSINEYISDLFRIMRDIKQSDSVSDILYNEAIKSFVLHLMNELRLSEYVDVKDIAHKVSMCVDDTTMYLIHLKQ
jgi:hypothetical protein